MMTPMGFSSRALCRCASFVPDMLQALPQFTVYRRSSLRDVLMRYAPVSIALSALLALNASVSHSSQPVILEPRAAQLEAMGHASLAAGDSDSATNAFEAALAVQPGAGQLVLDLADVARRQGMQGKALHYYRAVLADDPQNLAAIGGEGGALAEKGALDKARLDLAKLQGLCGTDCASARDLAALIDSAAAKTRVVTTN